MSERETPEDLKKKDPPQKTFITRLPKSALDPRNLPFIILSDFLRKKRRKQSKISPQETIE